MTKDTNDQGVDFNQLVESFLPHWHTRKPEELVSFGELASSQPAHIYEKVLRLFLFNRLSAFNPVVNAPAGAFAALETRHHEFDYLEGFLPSSQDETVAFDPMPEVLEFGTFNHEQNFF